MSVYGFIKNIYWNIRLYPNLKIGLGVDFENKGNIVAKSAFIGSIRNRTVQWTYTGKRSAFLNHGQVYLGKNTRIHKGLGIQVNGVFSMGNNSYINPNCIIICQEKIEIGNECAISWNFTAMDTDLHHITGSPLTAPIIIEDNVWIGANVTVLKGVRIGKGAVIAAQAVVTKNVPPHSLVAGNPAKLIREQVEWKM
nr:acyltransferase [Rhodocytophaga rosea]